MEKKSLTAYLITACTKGKPLAASMYYPRYTRKELHQDSVAAASTQSLTEFQMTEIVAPPFG